MATLTVQTVGRAGVDMTAANVAAGAGGDKFTNDGTILLMFVNGDGSSKTVTLVFGTGATVDGQTPAARTVVVGAGKTTLIGPFPPGYYNDASGFMNFTYSDVTSCTVGAFKIGS